MAEPIIASPIIQPVKGLAAGFATAADDRELRALLRRTPMEGRLRLTLEREPDFFRSAVIEGDPHYTVCARELVSDEMIAMGSRSVRPVYINGAPVRLGYLSQLRIHTEFRSRIRTLMRHGFRLLRETRLADEAVFDITTIIGDNAAARRILTAQVSGLPVYRELEPFITFVLPVRRTHDKRRMNIVTGSAVSTGELIACLQRNAIRHQFAPVWTAENLRLPGLMLENFHIAVSGDKVVGCLARWDQRSFKQTVVHGYDADIRRWRWLANLMGAGLPKVGSVMPMAFLSHLAADHNDPAVFCDLLGAAVRAARATDCRWLALGLAARHSLARVVREQFQPQEYTSLIYAVHEPGVVPELDGRIPHPEVAVL